MAFAVAPLGCGDDPVTPPVTTPASITTFSASEMSVVAGSKVNLSWKVANAANVTITAAPGGVLVDKSTMLEGSQMSDVINAQTTFTIVATGKDGGANAMRSVTVNVTTPAMVQIDTFTANPMTVAPGGNVTLAWTTSNATSVKIDVVNGANVVMNGMPNGSAMVQPAATTSYVLVATGANGTDMRTVTVTVEGTPVINSFMAMPNTVDAGMSTTLVWDVTGAATIILREGATDLNTSTMGTGNFMVTPSMTTMYTLVARSALGQEVTQMVAVTVNQAAVVRDFRVNPATVDYGDSAELIWIVERAPGGITISRDGVVIHTDTMSIMGQHVVTATRTTVYTLTAINPAGDTTAMATLTVNPAAPRFVSFTATPNPVRIGDVSTLAWSFNGATGTRLFDGNNTELFSTASGSGSFMFTATSTFASFRVDATNPNGTTPASLNLIGQNDPIIDALTAAPATFTQSSTVVTVNWASRGATSTALTINGAPAVGFAGTATGTYTFTTTRTADVRLTATNAVGMVDRTVRVLQLAGGPAIDAGQTASTAISLAGFPGASGAIRPTNDRDMYSFTVPAGGNVHIETSDGRGGCPGDTLVDLIGPDGTTILGTDDDDGNGTCSLINPRVDAFAANLPAGTYYVLVRPFSMSATFDYVITVTPSAPACGNGIFERAASEQCDDGNTAAGDGCTAVCQAEILATVSFPASQPVSGAIATAGGSNFVAVTMLATGYIGAEVFVPTAGRCDASGNNSADTVLTLFDSNFTVLGSDDNDGLNSCSRIDPNFDAFALVPAGTYYLAVSERGNDAAIPAYVLDVRTLPAGCGNAILEGSEECDDGNNRAGDGCNLICEFEGNREVEPNDTFATGTVVTATASIVLRGSLTAGPPADTTDFYLVDVPAGFHLDAYATVNGLTQCPETPEAAIGLFGTTGTQLGSTNTTGGPQGNCGRVWPYTVTQSRGMAAGRYGVRVTATGNNPLGVYFLHLNVIAPGCGNTILETGEQCEDGNTTSGDGCSATCGFEPVATINLTAAQTTTITGVISPEYNRDAVRVVVTGTTTLIHAETFVDAATGVCPAPTATRLRLFDSAGTELGNDTTDGVGSCSLIHPVLDTFASLVPGDYWLVVEEDGNNAQLNRYELVVTGIAANVCGNGIREAARGEECDGQSFCDSQCRIAPIGTLSGPPALGTFSESLAENDADFVRVDVTAPSFIFAETGEPTIGLCPLADTVIGVIDATSLTLLYSDDESGPGSCSRISGQSTTLPRVEPGSYYVVVEDFFGDPLPAYEVRVQVVAQNACGNTVREMAEQCDDGNTASGDGCSATCQIEPDGVVNAPGTQVFAGAIDPIGDTDIFQIVLAGPSVVSVQTGAPTIGVCATDATTLTLVNGQGTTVESDSSDGVGNCSLLGEQILPAGTYTLTVGESGNNALITAYEVQIVVTALANAIDGTVALGAAQTLSGALTPDGEIDVYQVTVAADARLIANVGAPTLGTCPSPTDTFLRVFDANLVSVATDDDDGDGNCSRINSADNVTLTAGTYYVVLEEFGRNGSVAAYELSLEGVVQLTPCGNGTQDGAEQCDDGNTASGDGCSATCALELGSIVNETEVNDLPASADDVGTFGAAAVVNAYASFVLDDADFFRFTLTAPMNVQISTSNAFGGVATECNGIDTQVWLYNAVPTNLDTTSSATEPALVQFDDDDNFGFCSLISGTNTAPTRVALTAGTYYVQVREFDLLPLDHYFVRFDFAP